MEEIFIAIKMLVMHIKKNKKKAANCSLFYELGEIKIFGLEPKIQS